jgi:hypothetical protein
MSEEVSVQEAVVVEEVKTPSNQPSAFGGIPTVTSDVRNPIPLDKQSTDIGDHTHRRATNEKAVFIRRFEDVGTCYHSFKYDFLN